MRLPNLANIQNPRVAAWVAIIRSTKEQAFVEETLNAWFSACSIKESDRAFAMELANGTVRRRKTLEYYLEKFAKRGLGGMREAERTLLQLTAYQLIAMDRVPAYAAVDQSVAIAKEYGLTHIAGFLNAVCRQLATNRPPPPEELWQRASYPKWFVEELLRQYSLVAVEEVLRLGNEPPKHFARERPSIKMIELPPGPIGAEWSGSPTFYIQNPTPVELLSEALRHCHLPSRILDLCAAPGGKAVLSHDIFPKAEIVAVDRSEARVKVLSANFMKYGVKASVKIEEGEHFTDHAGFDLVIIDAPCTNSGVLNKRAEARWRLTKENAAKLTALQRSLVANGAKLLRSDGVLCYLTCSILQQENERIAEWAKHELGLKSIYMRLQLPDATGRDGGFVACLTQ